MGTTSKGMPTACLGWALLGEILYIYGSLTAAESWPPPLPWPGLRLWYSRRRRKEPMRTRRPTPLEAQGVPTAKAPF